MAFETERKSLSLAGNMKIETIGFTATSVTGGVVSSKMSHIDAILINNTTSGSVAGQKAVASGQQITVSGLTSGDEGTLVVYGY